MLSIRLKKVADYLRDPVLFADIGSDHAYLPCYICLQNDQAKAIAVEVNDGPYRRALQTVEDNHLQKRIEVRKGNGLHVIDPAEVNQITIAGMGGKLIRSILEEGKEKLEGVKRLILQPNIDAPLLRKWLLTNHYNIVGEEIIEEDGYMYEILVADYEHVTLNWSDKELLFGRYLLEEYSNDFHKKWKKEQKNRMQLVSQMKKATQLPATKIEQLEKEIVWIEEVLKNDNS